MSKIAYDLDGVLTPDYNYIPGFNKREFYELTAHARPLFNPVGEYDIITARSELFRDITEQWAKQLATPPQHLIMKPVTSPDTDGVYKAKLVEKYNYEVYIESNPDIVKEMQDYLGDNNSCRVFTFDQYVAEDFATLTEKTRLFSILR